MGRRKTYICGSPEHQLMKEAGYLKPGGHYLPEKQGDMDEANTLPEERGPQRADSRWDKDKGKEPKGSVWEDPATEGQNATSGHRNWKSKIEGPGIPKDPGKYKQKQ